MMKEKEKNINEVNSDEKKQFKQLKPFFFFGFYFIFFSIIILMATTNHSNDDQYIDDENIDIKDKWELINNNYEYLYQINILEDDNNINISLEGKRFRNKNLFTKYVNDEYQQTVYIYYDEVKIKEGDEWLPSENFEMVYNDFNNNYINLGYIKKIIKEATLMESIINFDESITESYVYEIDQNDIINITVTAKDNLISTILLSTPQVNISLQLKNINEVKDFTV